MKNGNKIKYQGKNWAPEGETTSPEEQICTTWCFDNAIDGAACVVVCKAYKDGNHGLYHRALRRAQLDGLGEPHQHIFAAGAVWAWLSMTGLARPEAQK